MLIERNAGKPRRRFSASKVTALKEEIARLAETDQGPAA
jgi:hypothetical protein